MENQRNRKQLAFAIFFTVGVILTCLIAVLLIAKIYSIDWREISVTVREPNVETANAEKENGSEEDQTASIENKESSDLVNPPTVLKILESTEIAENDPQELAIRFFGIQDPQAQVSEQAQPKANGAMDYFWVLDTDENSYRQVLAELVYQTDHLYFWVEGGVEYDHQEVVQLATVFENQIYPLDRDMFGSEWTPGVDKDEHLIILYADKLGGASGYFSGTDSLMPDVKEYSNVAEMFYLSAQYNNLSSSFTYGVLAHEFQHMIHWYQDRNETSWLNEGFSELAVDINGFDIGGFDFLFAFNPDLSLTFWPGDEQGDSSPHYGASYLFVKYIYDQFGSQVIRDIVKNQQNGMSSINTILAEYLPEYDENEDASAGDWVFQNWTIANILQDPELENGIYAYRKGSSVPSFYSPETLECETDWIEGTVNQYGTDYIDIKCEDDFMIELEGNVYVDLLPVQPYSGEHYFWSNRGDESHMRLSREFDLTVTTGPITLKYWTWYDLESDYDYVYLTASVDGESVDILHPNSCTTENPTGANYGCGYNGRSGDWIQESVDLSAYAGKKVTIQFEYITDAAANGEGLVVDDISIIEIGYFSDLEDDTGGWQADGFVHISNQLPQAYGFAMIKKGGDNQVEKWISNSGLERSIEVSNNIGRKITLAISGLTRFTHIPAAYRLKVSRLD